VGGALAIYWPDRHPCGATRAESWLILHDYGGSEWAATLVDGYRLLGYLPGFGPKRPRPASSTIAESLANPSPVAQAASSPALFRPPADAGYAAGLQAGYAVGYRHAKEGR